MDLEQAKNIVLMEECLVSVGTDPYNKEELGERVFRDIYRVFKDCQDTRRSG